MLKLRFLLTGVCMLGPALAQEDPYLWLEEVESEPALDFAREHNARTLARLEAHPLFTTIYERNLEILNSDERIPSPSQIGGFVYNFWRDAEHVRGIWRRVSVEEYRETNPRWETVIDLDALAAEEGENWVWSGASCRYPQYDRCLIALSRGGADATVVREFDLTQRRFVEDGFTLPEAKSDVAWRDRDSIFVGTDFGDGSLTDSGYPRIVRIWRRDTPISEAETVFEGDRANVSVSGYRLWDGSAFHDVVVQATSFYTFNYFLLEDNGLRRLELPEDAELAGVIDGQALVELKTDWPRENETLPQGALIAAPIGPLAEGSARFEILFEPTATAFLAGVSRTKNTLVLNVLDNVVSRLAVLRRAASGWQLEDLQAPERGSIGIVSTELASDRFYFGYTDFLTPPSLFEADAATGEATGVKRQPAFFDADGMTVEQLTATSADGTAVPYFVVKPRGFEPGARNPTLLYGYGGFEISEAPSYSATVGTGWLEHGGVFVVANIRGGGEFGPAWHQAALKENRQRAYDDFIAVAEDLIARDITDPEFLGIRGGSNGGLLVGAAFVQRPDLFNAVVCQVPLLDMRRYHLLLAGASWMAEYGNPDDPDDWAYISRYSPYQNVSAEADYPEIFFFTSTRDDRVHPAHARKMVARMEQQGHDVLYYENIEGGHGGAANLNQTALNQALFYVYLHDRLNRVAE
ncbi:MAG TPA: prolyl oligopeptidase family serine peptidase [Gammaproteobacteria bacterium]|nr:prolyl oligopeptidase family serine peptidase [Gammaproteobacteria bacterium]